MRGYVLALPTIWTARTPFLNVATEPRNNSIKLIRNRIDLLYIRPQTGAATAEIFAGKLLAPILIYHSVSDWKCNNSQINQAALICKQRCKAEKTSFGYYMDSDGIR